MQQAPAAPRAIVMVDGQNLFHAAREAFGHTAPKYDIKPLAEAVCRQQGWTLAQARFYTGIPPRSESPTWNDFWSKKLLRMSRQGVEVFTRELRYRNVHFEADGVSHSFRTPVEKGIDVRMAIDAMRLAQQQAFDVLVIFSQDQDLSEVAKEIQQLAHDQGRSLKVVSAFPTDKKSTNHRGINGTQWVPIDRAFYEAHLDPMNYTAPRSAPTQERSMPGAGAPIAPPQVNATPKAAPPGTRIVDERGAPRVMYHGTQRVFDSFTAEHRESSAKARFSDGFYFASAPDVAAFYAGEAPGAHIRPAYLDIRSPLEVDSVRAYREVIDGYRHAGNAYEQAQRAALRDSEVLERLGYDGLIYRRGASLEVVAFRPDQIRSIWEQSAGPGLRSSKQGSPSRPQEASDLARRDAIARWISGSCVTDRGAPRLVYHGTNRPIHAIEALNPGPDGGIHFGTLAQAEMRALGRGKQLIPAYLRITNPMRARDTGGDWGSKIAQAKANGHDGVVYLNRYEGVSPATVQRAAAEGVDLDALSDAAFRKFAPEAADSFIVFSAEQVRTQHEQLPTAAVRTPRSELKLKRLELEADTHSGLRASLG